MTVKLSYGISILQQPGTSPRPSPTRGGRYKELFLGGRGPGFYVLDKTFKPFEV
jgi:hypothetical protein